jgi:hypothetical protein
MADFDLTQTDAQVQSILNDGQNMQGAGAQTTLTTESVLLKDVNGNYHKILKSSFTEAIRDTLAGLLVNNDKGTTINQIAAIASGDFGSITPANLASVLGVRVAPSESQQSWIGIFANVIETAYKSVSDYSKFDGVTTAASEGYFIGFKHRGGVAEAILLTRVYTINANIILFVRNSNLDVGTWSAYKLGISV